MLFNLLYSLFSQLPSPRKSQSPFYCVDSNGRAFGAMKDIRTGQWFCPNGTKRWNS